MDGSDFDDSSDSGFGNSGYSHSDDGSDQDWPDMLLRLRGIVFIFERFMEFSHFADLSESSNESDNADHYVSLDNFLHPSVRDRVVSEQPPRANGREVQPQCGPAKSKGVETPDPKQAKKRGQPGQPDSVMEASKKFDSGQDCFLLGVNHNEKNPAPQEVPQALKLEQKNEPKTVVVKLERKAEPDGSGDPSSKSDREKEKEKAKRAKKMHTANMIILAIASFFATLISGCYYEKKLKDVYNDWKRINNSVEWLERPNDTLSCFEPEDTDLVKWTAQAELEQLYFLIYFAVVDVFISVIPLCASVYVLCQNEKMVLLGLVYLASWNVVISGIGFGICFTHLASFLPGYGHGLQRDWDAVFLAGSKFLLLWLVNRNYEEMIWLLWWFQLFFCSTCDG